MRYKYLFMAVMVVCSGIFAAVAAQAQETSGKVIDIFGNNVTVQCDSAVVYNKGDKVDLTYMAGVMEMLIGQYEVVQTKDKVFIGREISQSIPPMKDMKVRISRAAVIEYVPSPVRSSAAGEAANDLAEVNTGAMDPRERDPRFLEANNKPYVPSKSPGTVPSKPASKVKPPVKVEVLGPNEGVDPSAAAPSGQSVGLLGAPIPSGQPAEGDPFGLAQLDPAQWKEVTFEGYKQQLINEAKFSAQYSKAGQNSPAPKVRLGVSVKTNDSPVGQAFAAAPMGVRVVAVTPGSPAEKSGLEVADIIYEIDNIKVVSSEMFVKYIFSAGNKVRLKVQRDGQLLEKAIALPRI